MKKPFKPSSQHMTWIHGLERREIARERERALVSTDSAQIQQILTDFNSTTALVQHLFGLLVSGFSNAIPFSTWKPQHFSFQN